MQRREETKRRRFDLRHGRQAPQQKEFNGGTIIEKYSYGLYKARTEFGIIDICKCLCDEMECDICKQNTYMHLTPNLDIKYCMKSDDVVQIDFENDDTIAKSFEQANKRLELIRK